MMGAYFKGPFTNFDFLDPFQTLPAFHQCPMAQNCCVGTYRLWFAIAGGEMELSHWVVKMLIPPAETPVQPHIPLPLS